MLTLKSLKRLLNTWIDEEVRNKLKEIDKFDFVIPVQESQLISPG